MSYPKIKDKNFNEDVTHKFKQYKIPPKKKTFTEICFPDKYELQQPQKFAAAYINPKTPYKGVLIFHKIGSGKTMTAINICEQWKNHKKILVVVPASLIGNFRDELRSQGTGENYLTNNERNKLKKLHPTDKEYIEIIEKSNERIDKYYNIYSYNKFVELIKDKKLNLKNTLLVIDEIQNMVSLKGTYYNVLYNTIMKAPEDLRIVLLSATPMFDSPQEFALTMNLLRIPNQYEIGSEFTKMYLNKTKKRDGTVIYTAKNLDDFKMRIKGYVSYFSGAPSYTFPNSKLKYVQCVMEDFQYRCYVTAVKADEDMVKKSERESYVKSFYEGELDDLPSTFFLGTRLISNVAFPNKKINNDGLKSFSGKHLTLSNLSKYSIKFYKIFSKIRSSPGPVFVYSNFLEYGGLKAFAKVLEANGYQNYVDAGEGKKRFAFITSEQSKQTKEIIKHVYNQKSNIDGSKLKVLLLSSAAKEGLSLKNVRQVHILEPYWNKNRLEQIIGRALRYCAHAQLPKDERFVKVNIYIAAHPNEKQTVDQYIYKLAERKQTLIKEFENAVYSIAVDCELNKFANGKDIVCDE